MERITDDPIAVSRRELADLIDRVQHHPLTPGILKDNINNALMSSIESVHLTGSPAGIDMFLAAHATQAGRAHR